MTSFIKVDARFVEKAQKVYEAYEAEGLSDPELSTESLREREAADREDVKQLYARLESATKRRDEARVKRENMRRKLHEGDILRDELNARINSLERQYREVASNLASAEKNNVAIAVQLEKSMQLNVLNDAFYIWYNGPYGTINNFRIGNVPSKPIEWSEINTALGETALALSVIVSKIPTSLFQFTKYGLFPMGSYSKVYKIEPSTMFGQWNNGGAGIGGNNAPVGSSSSVGSIPQGTALMNLYMDLNATFSLFPKSKFNAAIYGLMYCIYELGNYIASHDPPLCLPYKIDLGDGSGRSCTIAPRNPASQAQMVSLDLFWSGNASAGAYNEQDEQWTRALKFALSDVKWIIAWSSKHY